MFNQNFPERDFRGLPDMLPHFGIFQAGVAVRRPHGRIQTAANIQKYTGILAARKTDIGSVNAIVIHPLADSFFGQYYLCFKREALALY